MSNHNPPHWYDVYPQGTKEGSEEVKFFKALARSKFTWRSVAAIVKETGLSQKRVEEIITKYEAQGIIINNAKNENNYAYWELVPKTSEKKRSKKSISDKDKAKRVKAFAQNQAGATLGNFTCDDDDDDDDDTTP